MEDIKQQRHLLHSQIEEFNQQAAAFMFTESVSGSSYGSRAEDEYESSSDEGEEGEVKLMTDSNLDEESDSDGVLLQKSPELDVEDVESEKMVLQMPSMLKRELCMERGIGQLMQMEIELRTAQANDALQEIRDELGHKYWLYKEKQSHGRIGQKSSTRSWDALKKCGGVIDQHIREYKLAFKALQQLGATGQFKVIKKRHLKLSADITDAKRFNQSHDKLPWIWRTRTSVDGHSSAKTEESGLGLHFKFVFLCLIYLAVERVCWLRIRARQDRSQEAITTVKEHMGNTVRFFEYRESE